MASEPKSDTHRARTLGWLDMPHPTRTHPPFAPSTAGRRRSGLTDRSIDRWGGSVTDLLLPHEKWQAIFESGRRSLHATAHATYHYSFVERGFT